MIGRVLRSVALIAIGCHAVGGARAEPIQSYDTYKSWFVACDNTLSCVAKGFSENSAGRSELEIDRSAGPDGSIVATMQADGKITLGDIAVDGASIKLGASDWTAETNDGAPALTSERPDAVRRFLDRLRNGTVLTLGQGFEVPLDGLSAALLRMDERQGRIGNVTAIVRPGKTPASRVPPAPPVPAIPNHPIEATLPPTDATRLIEAVRSNQRDLIARECEPDVPGDPTAAALDASRALVLLPCVMGAYQGSSLAFIASRSGGQTNRLVTPAPYLGDDPDHGTVDFFTEADFDPATGMLSMAAKGRGLADCGTAASWIWNGTSFDLSALASQQSCGGVEPGDWPTLFRSNQ